VFKIGDTVWWATARNEQKSMTCPDCLGERALTVVLGDKSTVSIECSLCSWGFEGPHGYVHYSEHVVDVRQVAVTRVEQTSEHIEYGVGGGYRTENIFVLREDAEHRAKELIDEYNQEQLERVNRKEKDTHSWAWNARYHRECIRRAEKELAYHTSKLAVAKIKAKEKES
jgi:hypothetical protein